MTFLPWRVANITKLRPWSGIQLDVSLPRQLARGTIRFVIILLYVNLARVLCVILFHCEICRWTPVIGYGLSKEKFFGGVIQIRFANLNGDPDHKRFCRKIN